LEEALEGQAIKDMYEIDQSRSKMCADNIMNNVVKVKMNGFLVFTF